MDHGGAYDFLGAGAKAAFFECFNLQATEARRYGRAPRKLAATQNVSSRSKGKFGNS